MKKDRSVCGYRLRVVHRFQILFTIFHSLLMYNILFPDSFRSGETAAAVNVRYLYLGLTLVLQSLLL
ncbi:hypothetical protein PAE9249_02441 [Paenibacillus sp. CECT 9249]|nr:hypothetical protein PAE9249_02441 [Paenibacillus sp. CECT 9249]